METRYFSGIDIVEELVRINGYDKIKTIDPIKERTKSTLNQSQKLFHFLQRSIASKGYQKLLLGHLQTQIIMIF